MLMTSSAVTSVASSTKSLPFARVFVSSKPGSLSSNSVGWYLSRAGVLEGFASGANEVEISFFSPKSMKCRAKNFVKFDHSGSSHGSKITLSRNASGSYSK